MNNKIIYKDGDKNQEYQGDIMVLKNVPLKAGLKFLFVYV